MPDNRPVTKEALEGMIKALDDFMNDTTVVINALQAEANECADNMNGDMVSAKAIIRVNRCIGNYRQLNEKTKELRKRMKDKLDSLEAMSSIMD